MGREVPLYVACFGPPERAGLRLLARRPYLGGLQRPVDIPMVTVIDTISAEPPSAAATRKR